MNRYLLLMQEKSPLTDTPQNPDLLDSLIYATVILFILSVITEKLTQMTRAYPMQFRYIGIFACVLFYIPIVVAFKSLMSAEKDVLSARSTWLLCIVNTACLLLIIANDNWVKAKIEKSGWKGLKNVFAWLDVLCNVEKRKTTASKEVVEREVTILSFILGFIVAYTFNANLFTLFKNPAAVGWGEIVPFKENSFYVFNPEYFGFDFLPAVGFLLTAFFLAFGSKFFHDLLDTLLQSKNLKRKLVEKETFDIENVSELDEFLKYTQGQLVRKAIEENSQSLKSLPNFLSVHEGIDPVSGRTVAFLNIKDNRVKNLPDKLKYSLADKKPRFVPVLIVPNVQPPKVQGRSVNHTNHKDYIGSLGIPIAMDGENFWLTCDHVLTNGSFDPRSQKGSLNTNDKIEFTLKGGRREGVWDFGYQDREFDIALIKPDEVSGIEPSGLMDTPFKLSSLSNSLEVFFDGAKSQGDGLLIAKDVEEVIHFSDAQVPMSGLLKISKRNVIEAISKPGDSGAVLYTADKKAVAIILASNDQYTYAMSLERIFAGWDASIL